MRKKLLSILALLCLTVSGAWAGVTRSVSGGTLFISGSGAMENYGAPEEDSFWKNNHSNITRVVIEDGVTSICDNAFYQYTNLTSVTIGNSVTTIGHAAFRDCTSLTSIEIPNSVTSIGTIAFQGCSLTSVTIGSGVTSIGNGAFENCANLTSVTFAAESQLESIGNEAFYGCNNENFKSIEIPACVTSIGEEAFCGCTGLTSVTIPSSVTSIGNAPFGGCASLTGIAVAAGNENYTSDEDGVLFNKDKTTLIQYPIGNSRTTYTIPASVTSIGNHAFRACTNLSTVTFASGSHLASISNYAFQNTSLTSIEIPASVTSIGTQAFYGCASLTSVTVYATSVPTLSSSSFYGCTNLANIYVFSDRVSDYQGANKWSAYSGIIKAMTNPNGTCGATGHESDVRWIYDEGTKTLTIKKVGSTGAMADYSGSSAPWNSYKTNITSVVIEDGVTNIGDNAFYQYTNLESVTIPNSVTTIGASAFQSCTSLTSVTFAEGSQLESIGNDAFYGCSGLTSITIPASVTSIGGSAFYQCNNLASVTLNSNPFIANDAFLHIKSGATVTMNLAGNEGETDEYWMTFYNQNYNFEVPATTQIFKAALSGSTLALTELSTDQIVTKNNAVILKSTASPIVLTLTTTDSGNDFDGNSLQGVTSTAGLTASDPSTTYVLNKKSSGVGFYKLKAGKKVGVGKAYLTYSDPNSAREFFAFDEGGATAIEAPAATINVENGEIYDLQGRRVAQPTKGLYIVNGKKMVIK